ncbi:MAG: hypothetical protein AAF721_31645 [Myxococcota bacterium]
MRLRLPTVILGALVLAGPACATKEEAPSPPEAEPKQAAAPAPVPAPEPEEAKTKRVEIAKAEPPKVTLEKAGADPKEALRLAPTVAAEESIVLTMEMKMKMAASGQKMPAVTTPPMIVDARARVDAADGDTLKLTYAIDRIRVGESKNANPAVVATLKSMLEGMDAFEAHFEMDTRGLLAGGYVDVPTGLPPRMQQMTEQLQDSFAQIPVPLPEEPVGVGAKWTSVGTVDQGGMKIQQVAKYELLSRNGADIKLRLKFSQKLIDPTFAPPGMPGVKAKVASFQSGGKGEVEVSMGHLTPTSRKSSTKLKMLMNMSAMGQERKQDLEMDMGLALVRK